MIVFFTNYLYSINGDVYCILVTIKCDFNEGSIKDCGFSTKSEGNDASKKGFNWVQHSGSWVSAEGLEGPTKGKSILWKLFP